MKTFFMSTVDGKIEKTVVAEFQAHGETWVVHEKDEGFAVSHPGTGWGIGGSKAFDAETALALGKKIVEGKSPEKIKEVLEKALNYKKENE